MLNRARDRVHEFNQDDVLACFLPYHDSPVFTKMIVILEIKCVSRNFTIHISCCSMQASLNMGLPPALQNFSIPTPTQCYRC